MNITGQEKEIHIYDYLRVLSKWRKPAAILLLVIVCTVAAVSFVMTPVYRGTVRILIEREAPKVLNMQELLPVDASSTEFYQTQYKILQARSVALRVVRTLNLARNPIFSPPSSSSNPSPDKKAVDMLLAERLSKSYKVEPIRNSRLVDVSFESTDPKLAADVTNAIAQSYILNSMEAKTNTSQEAREFLTKQIEEQRKQLEESEQALQTYKEKYGIVQLTQVPGQKESENIAMQKLTGLTSNLVQAQTVRLEAESRYKEVKDLLDKGASYGTIPQISNNYLIQQLKVQEAQLETQLSEYSQKFGEKHPKMIQLRKEIDGVRQKIKTEAQQVIISLTNEYSIARAKEDSARRAMEGQKAETQRLSEHAIQYGVLLREVEKNRELYENLLKRLKEESVAGQLGTTNISIVDWAEVPRGPVKPRKAQNIALSLVVGLFMSIGLAFFLEYLDNTVKTPEDIKKYIDTPCIALIPTIDFNEEVGKDVEHPEIVVHHKPRSSVAEAFRSLRTAVLFSFPVNAPRSLLVTSFVPKEGKTFITANLAIVMAYAGESVLLIDADMRKPQIHTLFEISNEKGLSNYIIGEEAAIQRSVLHEKLDVITSGPIPPNPAELLGSKRMTDFVESMKGKYDKIIVDSPPVNSVTDAVVLSRILDGLIYVVHGGTTTRDMALHGATQLREVDAKPIGAVLNNVDVGKESYYYSHYYHYYYYYHDYYGHDSDKKREGGRRRNNVHKSSAWAFLNKPILSKSNDKPRNSAGIHS